MLCWVNWTEPLCVYVCPATVDSHVPIISISCCQNVSSRNLGRIRIRACYEQKPRVNCRRHAFRWSSSRNSLFSRSSTISWSSIVLYVLHVPLVCRVITQKNKEWCVNPEAAWLKDKMQKVRESHCGGFMQLKPLVVALRFQRHSNLNKVNARKLQRRVSAKFSSCSFACSSSTLQGKLQCLPELLDSAPRLSTAAY